MAKYESMLLPGEELLYKIPGVYDISQHLNTIGTLYITSFQSFFVDEARGQLKDLIPHGCVSSIKKYKNQSTNNVPITDKLQYLEVRCKDLRILKYVLPSSSRPAEVRRYLEHAALPNDLHDIFAFYYSPQLRVLDEGWNVYNAVEEYRRIGLGEEGGAWRISHFNQNFVTCPTYPEVFVVPSTISDQTLEKVAEFRSKARIPVCVWKHSTSHATITRCSQPLVGIGRRSEEDEALFRDIQQANKSAKGKTLYVVDARPKVNAAACTLSGGGTEIVGNYSEANVVLEYCGIANIHVVRDSFKRLGKVCRAWDSRKSKWSDIVATHWLDHIASILTAVCRMVTYVDTDACSVVTHCTDGWDRTSQLCALAELLMDPYYRTIKGFVVLICKEFISFGHKFNTRNGNVSHQPRSQCAPIFVQFMDCVWQLTRQFPTSFEFSENLLLLITTHLYTHLFGTFLADNDDERQTFSVATHTASLWGLVLNPPRALMPYLSNPMYIVHAGTLRANGHVNSMQLWRGYYQRWSEEGKREEGKEDGKERKKNKEEGRANGLTSSSGVEELRVTHLHEMLLVPFLDTLPHVERAEVRRELGAWIMVGDGQVKEKVRVVVTPRMLKGSLPQPEQKEKLATIRSAEKVKKVSIATSDDEGGWEDSESHGDRTIKRGHSFSAFFATMTGKRDKGMRKEEDHDPHDHSTHSHGTLKSHSSPNSHEPHKTSTNVHDPPTSPHKPYTNTYKPSANHHSPSTNHHSPPTTSHSPRNSQGSPQSPAVRIIGSTSRKNVKDSPPLNNNNTSTENTRQVNQVET